MDDSYYKYPPQDKDEFERLCQIVREMPRVRTIMEIGSRHGRSLIRLAEAAMPSLERIITIDLPGSLWGKANSEQALHDCAKHLTDRGVDVDLHLINSHSREAHNVSLRELGKVDVLFIDGDHTYEGVLQDYSWFSSCVRKGGIIALHDVCAPPGLEWQGHKVGVPRLWNKLCAANPTTTTTLHSEGSKLGIGVLRVGLDGAPAMS